VRSGTLRHRITVYNLTETQSSVTGELVQSWSSALNTWASIEPLKGKELFQSKQFQSKINTKITLRYSTLINAKSKINGNGGDYFIESPLNTLERNQELVIMCYKVQP
jgi:SPP1 family predicted phage head-tail adaptor